MLAIQLKSVDHKKHPIEKQQQKNNDSQYSLCKAYFDPISSSPPSMFINKLEHRISIYGKKLY